MRIRSWPCWAIGVVALAAPLSHGQLVCPAPDADAGTVKSGQVLSHAFRVVNRGGVAVEVVGGRTSCGCVAPLIRERTLAPGQETTVLLEINTLTQAVGPQSWSLALHSRPVGSPDADDVLTLTVRGTVVAEVRVEPTTIVLSADAPAPVVTLTDARPRPLNVVDVRTTLPSLVARLGETRQDAAGRVVRTVLLEVRPDCPVGRQEAVLSLTTDDPAYPELRVPVTVRKQARGGVRATPAEVTWGGFGSGPLPSRLVRLTAAGDAEVAVEAVEADHPALTCTWARGPGNAATLKVQADRTKIPGESLRSAVRVRLGGTGEVLTIPVSCSLR
jgi:hypothetical protein